jgi:hypothetical protein
VVAEVLGIPKVTYSAYGAGPLEISIDRVKELTDTKAVVHQHCIAHRRELGLFRAAGLKPVVLVRDIADSLVSYRDHRVRNSGGLPRDTAFAALSSDDQMTAAVLERAHWYFMFQATWFSAIKFSHIPAIMIDYKDLTENPEWAVALMLQHWGDSVPDEKIAQAVKAVLHDRIRANFNNGTTGRGALVPEHLRIGIDNLFRQEGISQDDIRSLCKTPNGLL